MPHVVQAAGTCSRVFFTDDGVAEVRDFADAARAGHRGVRGVLPRDARPAASTCRRSRTRRGSSPPPTTTAPSRPCSTPCPPPPAPRPPYDPRGSPMSRHDTIVHLLRHGEVHNPEGVLYGRRAGYHLSDLGRQMAERVADARRRPRHHPPASPRRSSAPRRPPRRWPTARGLDDRHRRAGDRVDERLRGQAVRRRRRRAAQARRPGGTCGTRSSRRGASPTRRSSPG